LNGHDIDILTAQQMAALESLLHRGSQNASQMLAKWIEKPSVVEIDSLEQLDLEDAANLLDADDGPMCFCSSEIDGLLTGELILAFDDASGFALADMLLEQPEGTSSQWTEMVLSAAMETTNILACSYLNSIATSFAGAGGSTQCLPSPPRFSRDFASSLLECALMGQAISNEKIILAKTRFEIDGAMANWTLLLIPDAPSMTRLASLLSQTDATIRESN
jgi:chemotaxis protein CheY-P-specific phosphatase CheC